MGVAVISIYEEWKPAWLPHDYQKMLTADSQRVPVHR